MLPKFTFQNIHQLEVSYTTHHFGAVNRQFWNSMFRVSRLTLHSKIFFENYHHQVSLFRVSHSKPHSKCSQTLLSQNFHHREWAVPQFSVSSVHLHRSSSSLLKVSLTRPHSSAIDLNKKGKNFHKMLCAERKCAKMWCQQQLKYLFTRSSVNRSITVNRA